MDSEQSDLTPGTHLQMVVDVVVPAGQDIFTRLAGIIDLLNAELHRHGLQETVWVARLPQDRG